MVTSVTETMQCPHHMVIRLQGRSLLDQVDEIMGQIELTPEMQKQFEEWQVGFLEQPSENRDLALAELILYVVRPQIKDENDLELAEVDERLTQLLEVADPEAFLQEKQRLEARLTAAADERAIVQQIGSLTVQSVAAAINAANDQLASVYRGSEGRFRRLHEARAQDRADAIRDVRGIEGRLQNLSLNLARNSSEVYAAGARLAGVENQVDSICRSVNKALKK